MTIAEPTVVVIGVGLGDKRRCYERLAGMGAPNVNGLQASIIFVPCMLCLSKERSNR